MDEPLANREARSERIGTSAATGRPRWVRPLGIAIAIALVGALFALHLSGAIGPGAH